MDDYLYVQAEHRGGLCLVRIAGELDFVVADQFTTRAHAAVAGVTGLITVDLSGLIYLDAVGARALSLFLRDLPAGQLAAVSPCIDAVSRVLRLASLPPPRSWLPAPRTAPDLVTAESAVSETVARLQETRIRAASTRERTGLTREQAQQARAAAKATRERVSQLLLRTQQKAAS